MLKEDQVEELLAQCERIVGKKLDGVRAKLKSAKSRSAAIWELLGIEEFSKHFSFDYEPPGLSRPDLLITIENELVAVDLTFLYPRFWRNNQKRDQVQIWLREELSKVGIAPVKVTTAFQGTKSIDGHKQALPGLHEKSKFVDHPLLKEFMEVVLKFPQNSFEISLAPYDIELQYVPSRTGEYYSSSGIVEEAGAAPKKSAIFRKIRKKARQHKLNTPLFLVIGGDDKSSIASKMTDGHEERTAVSEAFREFTSVSGIYLSHLEWSLGLGPPTASLESKLYLNNNARLPVSGQFIKQLQQLNMNQWSYSFALPEWEGKEPVKRSGSGGSLVMSQKADGIVLTIPSSIVLDALQGKSNLFLEYPCKPGEWPQTFFDVDHEIVDVRMKMGNLKQGLENSVEFTLKRRSDRVFK